MEKQDIKSMTQEELRAFLVSLGEKPFQGTPAEAAGRVRVCIAGKGTGADFADRWNPQVPVPPRGRQCHRECPDAL